MKVENESIKKLKSLKLKIKTSKMKQKWTRELKLITII